MKEFVEYLVKRLVKYPDEVTVEVRPDGDEGEAIYVKVADSDVGKVIGRQGKSSCRCARLSRLPPPSRAKNIPSKLQTEKAAELEYENSGRKNS